MGFPLKHIAVHHLYNTLPKRTNLGCLSVCRFKKPKWLNWSICFFISQVADDQLFYEAITSL